MTEQEQSVLNAIKNAGKPVRPADVVKMTGLTKEEVSKAIIKLKKRGKVTSPKRCFYESAEE